MKNTYHSSCLPGKMSPFQLDLDVMFQSTQAFSMHRQMCNLPLNLRSSPDDLIVACSALKRDYRALLVFGSAAAMAVSMMGQEPIKARVSELDVCDWPRDSEGGHPRNWPIFFHLRGEKETIRDRMMRRSGHFMPTKLIDSQFDALEEINEQERDDLRPSILTVIDITKSINEIAHEVLLLL